MDFFMSMAVPWKLEHDEDTGQDLRRYRRIWRFSVTLTLIVSLTPLLILTAVNFLLFKRNVRAEIEYEITRNLMNISRSIEFIIEERTSALELLVHENSQDELSNTQRLDSVFGNLKQSFGHFVDLGLIDAGGNQEYYTGPYNLSGTNYFDQNWFHEVTLRDFYVSDVFLGYRQFPHFVIAIKHDNVLGNFYVLRATLDMELLNNHVISPGLRKGSDVFLINQTGILQTASRFHGEMLGKSSIPVPAPSPDIQLRNEVDETGKSYVLGCRYIENTPFILMVIEKRFDVFGDWLKTHPELLAFLVVSSILIIFVVLWSSTELVKRIKAADLHRAHVMHYAEYANKMATIGRLAASVAHEINNPLAIINEKAGLLKDMSSALSGFPYSEKILAAADSIVRSVERCSAVTHRLLGFTRRMESHTETIDLAVLLEQVIGFVSKEASHQNIEVVTEFPPLVPVIESDRGQLQQVFLNIINNAVAVLPEGGRIRIGLVSVPGDQVEVAIEDNGPGIPASEQKMIFEPFYSTKGEFGTGLGLSITYDIVARLRGKVEVHSQVGGGTCFTVTLPIK